MRVSVSSVREEVVVVERVEIVCWMEAASKEMGEVRFEEEEGVEGWAESWYS